jgi:hypothetical protein
MIKNIQSFGLTTTVPPRHNGAVRRFGHFVDDGFASAPTKAPIQSQETLENPDLSKTKTLIFSANTLVLAD